MNRKAWRKFSVPRMGRVWRISLGGVADGARVIGDGPALAPSSVWGEVRPPTPAPRESGLSALYGAFLTRTRWIQV